MNSGELLYESLIDINSEYVDQAEKYVFKNNKARTVSWCAAIAGFLILGIITAFIIPKQKNHSASPDPIVENALTLHQLPLEWYDEAGYVDVTVNQPDGSEYRLRLSNKRNVVELSWVFEHYNWTNNIPNPNAESKNSEGDIILSCEGRQISFWYGKAYVRYKNAPQEKWFLSASTEWNTQTNITEELNSLLDSYRDNEICSSLMQTEPHDNSIKMEDGKLLMLNPMTGEYAPVVNVEEEIMKLQTENEKTEEDMIFERLFTERRTKHEKDVPNKDQPIPGGVG